jgi:hypothetical protein
MTNSKLRALLNFIIWMYKRKVLEWAAGNEPRGAMHFHFVWRTTLRL